MTRSEHWLLPEGIEEMLPEEAARLESLRRRLLDLYAGWGYELVIPPLVEYLESLLTGTGRDLDLQTFKLVDPASGRLLGVRADMTPQAARIDAHALRRDVPVRLCYLGTVLRTRPDALGGTRCPMQVGAELYGHAGPESDLEIIALMLETLACAGVREVHLDLGHVGIFRGMARAAGLDAEAETELFERLQRKALPDLETWLETAEIPTPYRQAFPALAELHGGPEILERARTVLAGQPSDVQAALDALEDMARRVRSRWPDLPLHLDLAELRGYAYQTGLVFAAFAPGAGQEIARGGRYDEIGRIFGRARPATGFSADLRQLMLLGEPSLPPVRERIFAPPSGEDTALESAVAALRAQGHCVIRALPGQAGADAAAMGCGARLVHREDGWQVEPLDPAPPGDGAAGT
ncbi:MAG: ATP phosphoribosyltransferase regulatory subunit [Gammaproteobacteria bacterium]|nr:MAG: ATP phosphoribosyltransferase regulatory subunit [Gammaproteobacteria bacterium]